MRLQLVDFHADLAPRLSYLVDADRELTAEQALKLVSTDQFNRVDTPLVDFGFTPSQFWLWTEVENATDARGTWNLVLGNPLVDTLAVYVVHESGDNAGVPLKILSHRSDEPFSARRLDYRNFVAEFSLDPNKRAGLLVAYSSKQATQQLISIESPDYFFAHVDQEDMHNFLVLGLLLGMTLVSVIYLTALRSKTAIYYGIYICSAALYLFHTDGYGFQFLWRDSPTWNNMATVPIGALWAGTGLLFGRAFINAPERHPRLNKLLVGGLAAASTMFVLSFWLFDAAWFKFVALALVVYCTSLYVAVGIMAVRRGQPGGRFFLFGALVVVAPILFGLTSYLTPGEFSQDIIGHGARYALIVEGTAFALAIFTNLQAIRRERDAAMRREIAETHQKLAALEALQEARTKHERAVRLAERRRNQLAATAHDIQQPVASLRMALKQVEDLAGPDRDKIAGSLAYIDQLLDSNLQQTRPETDHQPHDESEDHHATLAARENSQAEEFPVSVVLDNVVRMFGTEAGEKELAFRAVPSSLNVKADPIALMRIVSNLVSNAVKYTDAGGILLGCRRSGDRVSIEVHDTGQGLTPAELNRVLRPYEKGQTGGTGLGLAVVSSLCEEQGFKFEAHSKPRCGSKFRVVVSRSL